MTNTTSINIYHLSSDTRRILEAAISGDLAIETGESMTAKDYREWAFEMRRYLDTLGIISRQERKRLDNE